MGVKDKSWWGQHFIINCLFSRSVDLLHSKIDTFLGGKGQMRRKDKFQGEWGKWEQRQQKIVLSAVSCEVQSMCDKTSFNWQFAQLHSKIVFTAVNCEVQSMCDKSQLIANLLNCAQLSTELQSYLCFSSDSRYTKVSSKNQGSTERTTETKRWVTEQKWH